MIRSAGRPDVLLASSEGLWRPILAQGSRYAGAISGVMLATVLCFTVRHVLAPANLMIPYLLLITLLAYWLGQGPSALASALSVAVYDFCFIPPYYTFVVTDKQYVVTFAGLLTVSLTISTLTARARQQALSARQREGEQASLFALSRALSQALSEREIGQVVADHARRQFKVPVQFLSPNPDEWALHDSQRALALWAMQHAQRAGKGSDTMAEADLFCVPIVSVEKRDLLGGLAVHLASPLSPLGLSMLETFAQQAALALERARLSAAAQEADLLKATERLQSALLNSISHDLRIPLVSISGALQALKDEPDEPLDKEQRESLLDNALSESDRLNRTVGNLLHMTRLESGAVRVNLQPQELAEVVELTLKMLQRPERVRVDLPPDLPLVEVDFGLIQQVLANLLENALRFSPPESPVEIGARAAHQAELWVRDYGSGVPEAERELVFERFYRGRNDVAGSGLGLSICKGLLEAQGGNIHVEPADPGALFVVGLNWATQNRRVE